MKIKILHYVFGPCMKGYDIDEKKVIVQMGQKTIGLSEELLARPELLPQLEELSFGDAIDPNTPFDKVYFTALPGDWFVIGKGIRTMDSAGRKTFFFHHLVLQESELRKLNINPFALIRRYRFFEKESDLPEDRIIPMTEIDIQEEDSQFPVVDAMNRPVIESLVEELLKNASNQPIWVIIKRGLECLFFEQLLGLMPALHRKNIHFSTDFFNSYNIQHYFRLVTVNSRQEYPYSEGNVFNFVDQSFPKLSSNRSHYISVISQLPIEDVRKMVEDISFLQLNHSDAQQLTGCREIVRQIINKGKSVQSILFEQIPIETALILLGFEHPDLEPDYQAFTSFYGNFLDQIEPAWFMRLNGEEPAPLTIFTAFMKLLETHENGHLRKKIYHEINIYLKTIRQGELLNILAKEFPKRFLELLDLSATDNQYLFFLIQLPQVEIKIRTELTQRITLNLLNRTRITELDNEISQLPGLIDILGKESIETTLLRVFYELYTICTTGNFPSEAISKYSLEETPYRNVVNIGMNTINQKDYKELITKMTDYLYDSSYSQFFIKFQLEFSLEEDTILDFEDIVIHLETQGYINDGNRGEVLELLSQGKTSISQIKEYRKYLKKGKKDLPEYESLWETIEENAPRGLFGSMVRRVKDAVGM